MPLSAPATLIQTYLSMSGSFSHEVKRAHEVGYEGQLELDGLGLNPDPAV